MDKLNEEKKVPVLHYYTKIRVENIFAFLKISFPELGYKQYQKINYDVNFVEWVVGETQDGERMCCTAILRKGPGYKMRLFCVNKKYRRSGIGKLFFEYLVNKYKYLEWTATTKESILFYTSLGATDNGKYKWNDGTEFTRFSYRAS